MTAPVFDTLIVGGGTAGSVLANRLSADPLRRVLLVEAGIDTTERATPEEISDGLRPWLPRFSGTRFFWPELYIYRAAEHPGIVRAPQLYEQGRILGGGSAVNMVVSNRGLPRDYDEWERLGATGWGWKDILPYFRKLETDEEFGREPDSAALHGTDGPIPIVRVKPSQWSQFTLAATEALEANGLRNIRDQNGRFDDGYFPPTFTIRNEQRISAARAYLDDRVRLRPNLQLWTETQVLRLIFEGRRVAGVELRRGDVVSVVHAREVVLAAGALQSPAILLRAGIGPAAELATLGIPVLADRPGVGRNLWDHSSLGAAAALTPQALVDAHHERTVMHQLGVRLSSGVDPAYASDIFLHLGADPATQNATSVFWINKPSSSGYLRLTSPDPNAHPFVDFRLLSDARDLARLKFAVRTLSKLLAHPSLARYDLQFGLTRFAKPTLDGPTLTEILRDEAALETYLRTNVGGVWHASGTARIGAAADPLAVVDPAGAVYGVEGLRVADASVFPTVPAANTNLPVVAVAEKIADAIIARSGAQR